MADALRILCVHQGSELYGSDRVFIQSVKALRANWPQADITLHLPSQGPLTAEVKNDVNHLIIGDLWVLRLARLHPKYWQNFPVVLNSLKTAAKNMREHDVIYINTIAVIGYLLMMRFSDKKVILHIHEYADGWIGFGLRILAKWSGAKIIVNSEATAKAYDNVPSKVVWNGVADKTITKETLPALPLKLLLLGRINSWKGHVLAIDALNTLHRDGFKDVTLDIVGDVYANQIQYYDRAVDKIKGYGLQQKVTFHGFTADTAQAMRQAHAVLVPSVRPEPFGLVAIEAMMCSLPVIAADHGGLKEIVVQNETGLLVQPNNANALAEGIRKYIVHGSLLNKHGNSGRIRYDALFTEEHYFKRFVQAIEECIV